MYLIIYKLFIRYFKAKMGRYITKMGDIKKPEWELEITYKPKWENSESFRGIKIQNGRLNMQTALNTHR